jgi:basic membrane protein A
MKKRSIIALALAAVAAAGLLLSCGGKAESSGAAKADNVTVRLITDKTGKDDKSFNAAAWRGILSFYGDTWDNPAKEGEFYEIVTSPDQSQYEPILKQVSDEGYDLIITTGFTFADSTSAVAKQYPDQNYMIVDVDYIPAPNILQAMFAEHEGSYLVGVAAAEKAIEDKIANPKFGFIGGIPGMTITKFEVGYIQGIHSVIPGAEVVDYYANDWGAPELAKTKAKSWYDTGVYIIYSAAGGTGDGTIGQAMEYRQQNKNVWAIGVDSDQYEQGIYSGNHSAVYTSMLKRVESAVQYALTAVKNKSFKGETIVFDLKSDGVGYAATNPEMSPTIKAKIDEAAGKIKSGAISVVPTYAEAKKLPGFPQNLGAKDD